jgi:flagellar motility protein MotE (MotC chaperone)
MMNARWITAPALVLLVLSASWAWAAKDEPGVAADAAKGADAQEPTEARAVPEGMPVLPFGIDWQPIIDELPQEVFESLPSMPVVGQPLSDEVAPALLPLVESRTGDGADTTERPSDKTVWEASLAAREQALSRTQAALNREMERSEEILKRAAGKLEEAQLIRHYAEKACGGTVIAGGPVKGVLPPTLEELEENAKIVAALVKKMKPSTASEMLQRWDEPLIIDVIKRLSARVASPILGKMPAAVSGRITSRMLTGEVALRAGGTEQ